MTLATCHPQRLHKGRGLCGACYDRWLKSVNAEYKIRQRNNTSAWNRKHPDAKKKHAEDAKVRHTNDPLYRLKRREYLLRSKYGIDLAEYQRLLEMQDGGCAICGRKPGKTPLHVDHNHTTGIVRGLLCHQCNWYLGTVDKDPSILERIKVYRGSCEVFA
jgi:Recombination endonuclease VII